MSRLSIYETRWIDLVFENKNKEYGAYQMRRESVKSSVTALFMGLLFVASISGISTIASYFKSDVPSVALTPEWSKPFEVTKVDIYEKEKPALPAVKSEATKTAIVKDQLVNPVIVHPQDAIQDIATNVENPNVSDVISEGNGINGNPISSEGGGTATEIIPAVEYGNSLVNTSVLDKMPQFPGGMEKFYKYVSNNFEKPEIDASNVIKIYVSFTIEKDGSMTDIQVKRDPGYGLGREAIRVLKSLKTKWSPGMLNSKPVRTAYNLPISIQME